MYDGVGVRTLNSTPLSPRYVLYLSPVVQGVSFKSSSANVLPSKIPSPLLLILAEYIDPVAGFFDLELRGLIALIPRINDIAFAIDVLDLRGVPFVSPSVQRHSQSHTFFVARLALLATPDISNDAEELIQRE